MKHADWFKEVTDGDSLRSVESKSGVPYRTVQNQLKAERFSAENVIAIAEAYRVHPVGALVDTGYLKEHWARQIDPKSALRTISDEDFCDEALRRMKVAHPNPLFTDPVDQVAERRSRLYVTPESYDDDDTMPEDAAAYGGPDEDKLREERGEWGFDT